MDGPHAIPRCQEDEDATADGEFATGDEESKPTGELVSLAVRRTTERSDSARQGHQAQQGDKTHGYQEPTDQGCRVGIPEFTDSGPRSPNCSVWSDCVSNQRREH